MEPRRRKRSFSRQFKLLVIGRLERGESGTALERELTIKREVLYRWRDAFRAGGAAALRDGPGRPTRAEAVALAVSRGSAAKAGELARARRQIAELERKVGQQQQDLDFLERALRHIEVLRQPSDGSGVTASSRRSRR
jgi:transposase-like protein